VEECGGEGVNYDKFLCVTHAKYTENFNFLSVTMGGGGWEGEE